MLSILHAEMHLSCGWTEPAWRPAITINWIGIRAHHIYLEILHQQERGVDASHMKSMFPPMNDHRKRLLRELPSKRQRIKFSVQAMQAVRQMAEFGLTMELDQIHQTQTILNLVDNAIEQGDHVAIHTSEEIWNKLPAKLKANGNKTGL